MTPDAPIGRRPINRANAFEIFLTKVSARVGLQLPSCRAADKAEHKALERAILEEVRDPCGIAGAHLDRIPFAKHAELFA